MLVQKPAEGHVAQHGLGQPFLASHHPKVMEAKSFGDQLAQQLARAGAHGLDFSARPQQRELVTYDDL